MNFDKVLKYVIVLIFIFVWPAPRRRTILYEQTVPQPVKVILTFSTPEESSLFSQNKVTTLFSQPHVYTESSKKMDGIWNRYNLKRTGRIYTFGVLKCSEKSKVLDLP